MKLRFPELQAKDHVAKEVREQGLKDSWDEDIDRVLYQDNFSYVSEIIRTKLISWHYDDALANHLEIEKTYEFVAQKYNWPTLQYNVETYIKYCNVYLAFKIV